MNVWALVGWLVILAFAGFLAWSLIELDYYFSEILGFILLVATVIMLGVVVLTPMGVKERISVFENQKEYLESHVSSSPLEDVELTNKKLELNTWLFGAQWAKEQYKWISFYPESILELEPIQ